MLYSDHLQLKQQQKQQQSAGQVTVALGIIYKIINVLLKDKFHYSE